VILLLIIIIIFFFSELQCSMPQNAPYSRPVKHRYHGKDVEVRHPKVELTGEQFLTGLRFLDNACETHTLNVLFSKGREGERVYELFGKLLSIADRLGGCWWGCDPTKHPVTYLIMRTVGVSRGAIRLMQFGMYDEALTLVRTAGEAANLLMLVERDPASYQEWETGVRLRKKSKLTPLVVRQRLNKLNISSPIHPNRYARLSELVHAAAPVMPQHYSNDTQPRVGGMYQEVGATLVLYELGLAMSLVTAAATKLLMSPGAARRLMRRTVVELADAMLPVCDPPIADDWPIATRMAREAAPTK